MVAVTLLYLPLPSLLARAAFSVDCVPHQQVRIVMSTLPNCSIVALDFAPEAAHAFSSSSFAAESDEPFLGPFAHNELVKFRIQIMQHFPILFSMNNHSILTMYVMTFVVCLKEVKCEADSTTTVHIELGLSC